MRLKLAILFLCSLSVESATVYCSPSGGGSGANFSNLATMPDTTGFTRGNTYVLVEGSYGQKTFSTAQSGSTRITIRLANAAEDSGVTGYSSTLHDGPAEFSGLFRVRTPNWTFDGIRRTETTRLEEPTGYGFRLRGSIYATDGDSDDLSGSIFRYMDIGGEWSTATYNEDWCSYDGSGIYMVFNQHDVAFERVAIHNTGHNGALVMAHGSSDITWDHVDFYMGTGKSGMATPNSGQDGHIVRYCRFWRASQFDQCPDVEGGGITTELGTYSYSGTTTGNEVYGCIFYVDAEPAGRNAIIQFGENSPGPSAVNCKVYNNTFVGFPNECAVAEVYLFGGSGNEIRNNLFYTTSTPSLTANTTSNNVDQSTDPFVDSANLDFRLAQAIAGTSLGSPYATDPSGATRGSDGTFDVGAFEFDGGGGEPGGSGSGTIAMGGGTISLGGGRITP